MMVRRSGEVQMNVVNVKSQSELDIGGRETCLVLTRSETRAFLKMADVIRRLEVPGLPRQASVTPMGEYSSKKSLSC